jgi:hypothetical protein
MYEKFPFPLRKKLWKWLYNKGYHYNKRCPCTPNDFIGFWLNPLVVMNEDQWGSSESTGLMNKD